MIHDDHGAIHVSHAGETRLTGSAKQQKRRTGVWNLLCQVATCLYNERIRWSWPPVCLVVFA